MARDPFEVLALPPRFDLSPAVLQSAYLALSARLHPDTAAASGAGPPADGGREDHAAAELNAAKRALENPETRADVLLRRHGGPSGEQDRSLPPAFLAEMLEVREEIEAAVASGDRDAIGRWEAWAAERRRGHIAAVGRLFASLAPDAGAAGGQPGREGVLKAIRGELNMWRYAERLIEELEASLE